MNLIIKYREAAKITQVSVAKNLNVSTDMIWRWETGANEPRSIDLLKMAHLFSCSVDDLLGNPTAPPPSSRRRR